MSKRGLFTYTTKIEPQKTVNEINEILASHGANAVLIEYDKEGKIKAISFKVNTPSGERGIKLPCKPEPVYRILKQQNSEGKIPLRFVDEHQALRVSWRIILYWIKAQMAILETEMVSMEQIFLPYMIMQDNRTLYDNMLDSRFQITDGGDKNETKNPL